MKQISLNCPHCAMKSVAATTIAMAAAEEGHASIFATCNNCRRGVVLLVTSARMPEPVLTDDMLDDSDDADIRKLFASIHVLRMDPAFPTPRAIMHVPAQIEGAYREGEMNRADKRYLSAAGNYRTALDRALKDILPQESGTIFHKVEKLAARNALPAALINLMHEIRFLGNQIHDTEDPEPEDVEAGADFVALLLTYLYELPGRVAAAEAKRQAMKEDP